jgi:oxidoreductase
VNEPPILAVDVDGVISLFGFEKPPSDPALGWHLIDVISPMLGPAEIRHVAATTSEDFVTDQARGAAWRGAAGGSAGDVEDTVRGFLVTRDGVSVGLRASWASHEPLDVTRIVVEGTDGWLELRCTFGFSPHRAHRATLLLTRDGRQISLDLPEEPVGAEYDRQLDDLLKLLADPTAGQAVAEAQRTIGLIERMYDTARRLPAVTEAVR